MDEVIIEELRENRELLDDELVDRVDSRPKDAHSMCLDWVEDLVDTDGLYLLCVSCYLDKDVGVQVVIVAGYVLLNVA